MVMANYTGWGQIYDEDRHFSLAVSHTHTHTHIFCSFYLFSHLLASYQVFYFISFYDSFPFTFFIQICLTYLKDISNTNTHIKATYLKAIESAMYHLHSKGVGASEFTIQFYARVCLDECLRISGENLFLTHRGVCVCVSAG